MRSDQSSVAPGAAQAGGGDHRMMQMGGGADRPVPAGGESAAVPQMQAQLPGTTAEQRRVSFRDWAAI